MTSMNPMLRNTPTAAERFKMQNTGYSLNQVRDMQNQQTMGMRMGAGAPTAFRMDARRDANNAAFMMDRAKGGTGAPQRAAAPSLALMAGMEGTAGMDPAAASAMMMMPPAPADTGEGRMAPRPREPDPFAGGYQATSRDDPFSPNPRKRFAEGGPVIGPGGPKDDKIPAKLSHGEYVMPAEVVQFFGIDRLNKMVEKAKQGAAEQPMPEMKPDLMAAMGPMMPGYAKGGPVMPMMGMVPGYAEGGFVDKIGAAATRARLREQDAMLSPDPYGPTLNDSPAFQPLPRAAMMPAEAFQPDTEALADMRARRFLARSNKTAAPDSAPTPSPMPMMMGQQPPMMLAAPMPEPAMRPAPLTMTEKEQLMMQPRAARTPQADPAFEAAMTGFSGMGKRKARSALAMEEASFARGQDRDAIAQAAADARAAQDRAANQEWWKQQQEIGRNFEIARENRNLGNTAAMRGAEQADADAKAKQQAEANRRFSPVLDAEGNPIPGRMMNPQGQQLNTEPTRAEGIRMEPVPGMPGRVLPMIGGSRVPGMPMLQAQTQPGPFREGLGRTSYTPIQEAPPPAAPPTMRKSERRAGATKEAPEWEYATMSDTTTRPITIENPRPDQMVERFKHEYGKAPQTEAEWTDAWYLTTGQPKPASSSKPTSAASAAAAPQRAKIKSATLISAPAK